MITFSVSYEIPSLAYGVKVFFGLFQFYFFFRNRDSRLLAREIEGHKLLAQNSALGQQGLSLYGTMP